MITGSIENPKKLIFDNLSFGSHFKADNQRYIKVKPYTTEFGWTVLYNDEYGNLRTFNAISYQGIPTYLNFDVEVTSVLYQDEITEIETVNCLYKISVDKSESSDNIFKSSDTVSDKETLLKNKHIETTNKMQTYNTLKEAVLAAITELRNTGSLSAYQVTQFIREQTNNDKWEVTSCIARPNGQNIKFWINHDDVRREINELYANHELDSLGFVNRNYNGTYLVYEFDTTNLPVVANGATPIPNAPSTPNTVISSTAPTTDVNDAVAQYLKNHIDYVEAPTLKKIQSAVKVNGVTCEQFAKIVENLGYNVVSGTVGFYSTYYVTTK